jgi:hypothetical protein
VCSRGVFCVEEGVYFRGCFCVKEGVCFRRYFKRVLWAFLKGAFWGIRRLFGVGGCLFLKSGYILCAFFLNYCTFLLPL